MEQKVVKHQLPNLHRHIEDWSEDLMLLWQNTLLDVSSFSTFAQNRGVHFSADKDNAKDWLSVDNTDSNTSLFHPFRLYPLFKACCLYHNGIALEYELLQKWNRIADLAILLEPVFWPQITKVISHRLLGSNLDLESLRTRYREQTMQLLEDLDPDKWKRIHRELRFDANSMDGNGLLYILLRLAPWALRNKLTGSISGALWIRHIAETIRLAFEEKYKIEWLEEDQTGPGRPSLLTYLRPRLLSDELGSKPYIAKEFGLFTCSTVRWYVEGITELYAIKYMLPDPPKGGIELLNLSGEIKSNKRNSALKLEGMLKEDKRLKRFSFVMFDVDVDNNIKFLRRQIMENNIVGYITAQDPDFEFCNFTIDELIEIAARLAEEECGKGQDISSANWSGIKNGREFEDHYKRIANLKDLKGEKWGEALAQHALERPHRPDTKAKRPLISAIEAILIIKGSSYDIHSDINEFDPNTFRLITKQWEPDKRIPASTSPDNLT